MQCVGMMKAVVEQTGRQGIFKKGRVSNVDICFHALLKHEKEKKIKNRNEELHRYYSENDLPKAR